MYAKVKYFENMVNEKDKTLGEVHTFLSGVKATLNKAIESLKTANQVVVNIETAMKEENESHLEDAKKL